MRYFELFFLIILLCGCGQSGHLYLPNNQVTQAPHQYEHGEQVIQAPLG